MPHLKKKMIAIISLTFVPVLAWAGNFEDEYLSNTQCLLSEGMVDIRGKPVDQFNFAIGLCSDAQSQSPNLDCRIIQSLPDTQRTVEEIKILSPFLKKSQKIYKISKTSDFIYTIDSDGKLFFLNPQAWHWGQSGNWPALLNEEGQYDIADTGISIKTTADSKKSFEKRAEMKQAWLKNNQFIREMGGYSYSQNDRAESEYSCNNALGNLPDIPPAPADELAAGIQPPRSLYLKKIYQGDLNFSGQAIYWGPLINAAQIKNGKPSAAFAKFTVLPLEECAAIEKVVFDPSTPGQCQP